MPNDRRHLIHVRTSMLEYVHTLKSDIPVSASVETVGSVPSSEQLEHIQNPSRYIQLDSGNHWYYELTGKRPSDLAYGEIAIAFRNGSERIYIRNSSNAVTEFRPWVDNKSVAYMFQAENDTLTTSDGTCTWEIPYADLKASGVNPDLASVTVREVATGKQTVPDAVFDDGAQAVRITLYSKNDISAGAYRALITGLNYGE